MADLLSATLPVVSDPVTVGGVTLELVPPTSIVSLGAFAGAGRDELVGRVRAEFGVDLPDVSRAVRSSYGNVAFLWNGPTQWLVVGEDSGELFSRLQKCCGDVCALTSQGDSRTILRLSGMGAREVATRLLPIDLHGQVFSTDCVASTLAGHIPVIVWQTAQTPAYDFLVFRSFASSLFHDLSVALNGHTFSETDHYA
ncbi:sarcosine oxidase gamma subunit [Acetobacter estunensis NRIC 0472]|uniref:Sarcosine oxidase subunit gamma n=1 Tax=Acetobacter estunensis TaxID=104097 RepID=A0A967B378_9PROT|nr:sarcosine oxidase subunit gamma family protein [Acetobacter estunensis]NHO52902.1 sarcosine oxidase subunit gamma [Acetobacter estunensis]GBQ28546.1 sarcosine oxidase gamma subunit [Acetobacter estunensis NRIC 0472]